MKAFLPSRWPLPLCIVLLASCATSTRVEAPNRAYSARESDCEITFFKDAKPSVPFETLGKIESHIAKNFFFVIDDHIQTSASEMTHLHVWATVIRFPSMR